MATAGAVVQHCLAAPMHISSYEFLFPLLRIIEHRGHWQVVRYWYSFILTACQVWYQTLPIDSAVYVWQFHLNTHRNTSPHRYMYGPICAHRSGNPHNFASSLTLVVAHIRKVIRDLLNLGRRKVKRFLYSYMYRNRLLLWASYVSKKSKLLSAARTLFRVVYYCIHH